MVEYISKWIIDKLNPTGKYLIEIIRKIFQLLNLIRNVDYLENNFGWIYYGRNRHTTGKSHFVLPDTTQTLCRLYKFTLDDKRNLRFTSEDNLFKNKLCRKCLEILSYKSMPC